MREYGSGSTGNEFAGLPVRVFGKQVANDQDPGEVAWFLEVADGFNAASEEFAGLFEAFVDHVGAAATALVIGEWGESYDTPPPLHLLVDAADRLPHLRALFIADLESEQCEISWINQTDITPVLEAFPRLEVLHVRGAEGLRLRPVRHEALREFVLESGGLPGHVVRAVGACDLPALVTLELWLGVAQYGGDAGIEDLAEILAGARLPVLRSLGLCDSELADEIATAVASAPIVARIEALDLSMGVLSDRGAEALLDGQPLTHLRQLDLSHHFISDSMARRLRSELPGVDIDLSDAQDERRYGRFVAVSE